LLKNEFKYICQKLITIEDQEVKDKKKKIRKKFVNIIAEPHLINKMDSSPIPIIQTINISSIVSSEIYQCKKEKDIELTASQMKPQIKTRKNKNNKKSLELVEV
jgi:hypothetical protein